MNNNTLKTKVYESNIRHKKSLSMNDIQTSPIIVRSPDIRLSSRDSSLYMKLSQRSLSSIAL